LGLSHRLQDLREQVDIVLPEMTARIAALEHLLLEKQLCTRKDLVDARQFVRRQEA
jgi:Holliday junction resolvasome RuvABC endonuclease subunit